MLPTEILLTPVDDINLTDMVSKIMKEPWGMNTNFMTALDKILSIIVYKKIHPTEIPKLTLCIFSDMQIDCADKNGLSESFWEHINKKYHDTGMVYYGIPFNTPNILDDTVAEKILISLGKDE